MAGRIMYCTPSVCRPSVSPFVRLSRVSDFLKIGKPQKLLIQWKHNAGNSETREQIADLKVKGQSHWER